jgi:hypothetical protein
MSLMVLSSVLLAAACKLVIVQTHKVKSSRFIIIVIIYFMETQVIFSTKKPHIVRFFDKGRLNRVRRFLASITQPPLRL